MKAQNCFLTAILEKEGQFIQKKSFINFGGEKGNADEQKGLFGFFEKPENSGFAKSRA